MKRLKKVIALLMALLTAVWVPGSAFVCAENKSDHSSGGEEPYQVFRFVYPDNTEYRIRTSGEDGEQLLSSTQVLKDGEPLVDPGMPDLKPNQRFEGWYLFYGTDREQKAPFGIPAFVEESAEITVTAKITDLAYVTFYEDEEGRTVRNRVAVELEPDASGKSSVGILDLNQLWGGVPAETGDRRFRGWADLKGRLIQPDEDGCITVTGDMELYPIFDEGAWLYFDRGDNDKDAVTRAEYIEPVFVGEGGVTKEPKTPTRQGYLFDGWYTDASYAEAFEFGEKPDGPTTLYAKWQPDRSPYAIVIWQQNADDDGYSYKETIMATGETGSMTRVASRDEISEVRYSGFHLSTEKRPEDAVIHGDRSTIVNVYYDRNIYDIDFRNQRGQSIEELRIRAKYGAQIDHLWPGRRTDLDKTWPTAWLVSTYGNTIQASIDTMPIGGGTFYYQQEDPGYTMSIRYWTQDIGGGDHFTLHHTDIFNDSDDGWNTTVEDYYGMTGFTVNFAGKWDADGHPNYATDKTVHTSPAVGTDFEADASGANAFALSFYYLRNRYTVTFEPMDDTEAEVETLYFEEDMTGAYQGILNKKTVKRFSGGQEFRFDGWYDNPEGSGEEYVLDGRKMPAANIVLYARWVPLTYHVILDANGGQLPAGQADEFDVQYHDVIPDCRGTRRDGYTLVGWYRIDPVNKAEILYNFGTLVEKDTRLIAQWKKNGNFTIVYDTDGKGSLQGADCNKYADLAETSVLSEKVRVRSGSCLEFVGWDLVDPRGPGLRRTHAQSTCI